MKTAGLMIVFALVIMIFGCGTRSANREEMARRCESMREENTFWKIMEGTDPTKLPDTYGRNLGIIAYLLLSPLSEYDDGEAFMGRYEAYLHFRDKSGLFLTKNESEEIIKTLAFSKSPGERLTAFQLMLAADQMASDFLFARLSDEERINAFLRGEKIPPIPEPSICKHISKKTAIRAH